MRFDKPKPAQIDFERFALDCQEAAKPEHVSDLAKALGLSINSLRRLHEDQPHIRASLLKFVDIALATNLADTFHSYSLG